MVDLMAPGTHHALILFIDQQMTLVEPRLRRRARTAPRAEGARARVRRRLDRALDGPPRRVPRELRLGAHRAAQPHAERVLPAAVLDQLRSRRAHRVGALADSPASDRFIWASDFPHSDAKYPGVVDELREHTEDMDAGARAGLFGAQRRARCTASRTDARAARRDAELDLLDPRRHRRRRHRRCPRAPPTSACATARIVAVGRLDDARGDRDHRRRRAARRRRASSTSTRTTTRSCTGTRPRRRRRGTASRPLITGNCGFTLAPGPPDDVAWLLLHAEPGRGHVGRRRSRQASTFAGGSLGDFLAGLDGRLGVNVGRERRPLRAAPLRDGRRRVGTRTAHRRRDRGDAGAAARRARRRRGRVHVVSQLELHVAHDGRGVPSNLAAPDELVALASVLADVARRRSSSSPARSSTATTTPTASSCSRCARRRASR